MSRKEWTEGLTVCHKIKSLRDELCPPPLSWRHGLREWLGDCTRMGFGGYVLLGLFALLAPALLPVMALLSLLGWAVAKLLGLMGASP